jgi:hypothetical protein
MLNPKLETLNSKQTQMALPTCRQAKHQTQSQLLRNEKYFLSFIFWICLGFRV